MPYALLVPVVACRTGVWWAAATAAAAAAEAAPPVVGARGVAGVDDPTAMARGKGGMTRGWMDECVRERESVCMHVRVCAYEKGKKKRESRDCVRGQR